MRITIRCRSNLTCDRGIGSGGNVTIAGFYLDSLLLRAMVVEGSATNDNDVHSITFHHVPVLVYVLVDIVVIRHARSRSQSKLWVKAALSRSRPGFDPDRQTLIQAQIHAR